jgi:hypothetical protein
VCVAAVPVRWGDSLGRSHCLRERLKDSPSPTLTRRGVVLQPSEMEEDEAAEAEAHAAAAEERRREASPPSPSACSAASGSLLDAPNGSNQCVAQGGSHTSACASRISAVWREAALPGQ